MSILWRGLIFLPLLLISGNCNTGNSSQGVPAGASDSSRGMPGALDSSQGVSLLENKGGKKQNNNWNKGGKKNNGRWNKGGKKNHGPEPDIAVTGYKGKWELFQKNGGVSAMHLVLFPKIDQVLMFDATVWKISKLKLPGPPCRKVEGTKEEDCFCHSVLMDIETAKLRPLRLNYDTWCSSGALDVNGRLISTGGYNNGSDTVRILDICPTCQWKEYPDALGNGRWYATQVTLSDGKFMVFGGRNFPSYEFVPEEGQRNDNQKVFPFKFLADTNDPAENNLYPFVYLATDGNLFIFANNRSILLNPNNHKVIHEFPVLPGGSRNYPSSACSTLLPIKLNPGENRKIIPVEVLICGGSTHDAFTLADLKRPKVFAPANKDCARIDISKRNGQWRIQPMPSPRLMGDAMLLPTGDVLLVNGAMKGSAGWDDAREPNLTPILYRVRNNKKFTSKFSELMPSTIPRMYHSTAAVLPDGKIMIAGSNTNPGYLDQALFPTEVRVEKFSPDYLDPALNNLRVDIDTKKSAKQIHYKTKFNVLVKGSNLVKEHLEIAIYYPAFTTHGISMNQRLVQLAMVGMRNSNGTTDIQIEAPLHGKVAPPGYYMLFVNNKGIPCKRAIWVQLLLK